MSPPSHKHQPSKSVFTTIRSFLNPWSGPPDSSTPAAPQKQRTSTSIWDPDEDEFPAGSPFKQSNAQPMPTIKLPKAPSKNIWDPDEEEFPDGSPFKAFKPLTIRETGDPDWPGTYEAAYGTATRGGSATVRQSRRPGEVVTVKKVKMTAGAKGAAIPSSATISQERLHDSDANFSAEQRNQIQLTVSQLRDPSCADPEAADPHDNFLFGSALYRSKYAKLPADTPARHMHILDWTSYSDLSHSNAIIASVRPRLCDAIATLLFETDVRALDAFLDGSVKVFEWRHEFAVSANRGLLCAVVRRVGSEVLCTTYRNHGFTYLHTFFLKSIIHHTGQWSETWACGQGTTPIDKDGPAWERFTPIIATEDSNAKQNPADAKYALYLGRQLGEYLVDVERNSSGKWMKLWEFGNEAGEVLEWEADGVVTRARVRGRGTVEGEDEE